MTSYLRGQMRATALDGCGNPKYGPTSQVVTDGFITIALTANTFTADTVQITNAAGNQVVNEQPEPVFQNWSVEITMVGVDPSLFTLLTGQKLRMSADGTDIVGFSVNSKIDVSKTGFALESWLGVAMDACASDDEIPYGYALIPFLKGGSIGDLSVENGAINFVVTGAVSRDGSDSGWGAGPYNVTRDESGVEGPLNDPVITGDHLILETVTVAPPTDSDGAIALGVPATTYTAGSPGTLSPAHSYPAADLAALSAGSATKSPTTAWTTGTYIVLGDGSKAHWSGTAWAAGPA